MIRYYTDEEIQRQLKYLQQARGVTEEEREVVLAQLKSRIADEGVFKWVQCPVWRYRLYQVSRMYGADIPTLNRIMRYVLEGEQLPNRVSVSSTE